MRKLLLKLLALTIGINPIISLISCTDSGTEVIDDRDTTESLSQIQTILQQGIDTKDTLSVRDSYNDGFNFIANYVKKLNAMAITKLVASGKKVTDKLNAGSDSISIMVTLGLSELNINAILINVLSELQVVIKLDLIKRDKWNQQINMSGAIVSNAVRPFSSVMFSDNEIDSSDSNAVALKYIQSTAMFGNKNKYNLQVSLHPSIIDNKLQAGQVILPLQFNLIGQSEQETLNVALTNITQSSLDSAAGVLSNIDLSQTNITSKNNNISIINYLNNQLQTLFSSNKNNANILPVKVEEILAPDESEELNTSTDNILKVKLVEDINNGRTQDNEIILKNVTPFVHTMAYDLMDKLFDEHQIIFALKVNDTIDKLKKLFNEEEKLIKNYYFIQRLDFSVTSTSRLETNEITDENEPFRELNVRWQLVGDNKVSQSRIIKYTVSN